MCAYVCLRVCLCLCARVCARSCNLYNLLNYLTSEDGLICIVLLQCTSFLCFSADLLPRHFPVVTFFFGAICLFHISLKL